MVWGAVGESGRLMSATQTLTVVGADGVSVPFTDPRFVSVSGYYATAAIS
jgi:hypothetical protein